MKTRILTTALAITLSISGYSQKDHCNCFNKEEYKTFVKNEQNQTVIEGQDAELTVLLSKKQKEDIIITYKVTGETANVKKDITLPASNTFRIPAGETQATIHIPTVYDNSNELDETFTIEIIEGITATTKKKLNNNKLVRTRTIIERTSNISDIKIYRENGIIKTTPATSDIEVRNMNGILIPNKNINTGVYFIKATSNKSVISKTVAL